MTHVLSVNGSFEMKQMTFALLYIKIGLGF